EIWVVAGSENGAVFVEFTDSGPGVTDPKRVFDPFYTTKPVGKGTGLGLSICYGIIKEHGGEIEVRNSPPRGATFRVSLPMQRVPAPGDAGVESPRELPPQGVVLVVDDEESLLELEQEILRAHSLTVLTARNGREAIDVLSRETVDVVVTDLKMPGAISGRHIYEWVESRRPRLHTRVVFTMSDARRDGVRELIESSGCAYLQKPFNVEDFLGVVRQALYQAQASQPAALS
ncbi:MAG TPA: response regulator, partial [Candidatus Acidoferrales bacterium]